MRTIALAFWPSLALSAQVAPLRQATRARRRSCCSSRTRRSTSTPASGPAEKAVTELGKTGGFEVTTVEGYKQDAKQLDFSFLTPRIPRTSSTA